jgi:hypothetical protein
MDWFRIYKQPPNRLEVHASQSCIYAARLAGQAKQDSRASM